jgi:predicted methyltransferase
MSSLGEFHRVLVPGGTLALSEFLLDPDSQTLKRVRAKCEAVGFHYRGESGNLLHYTRFDRPGE